MIFRYTNFYPFAHMTAAKNIPEPATGQEMRKNEAGYAQTGVHSRKQRCPNASRTNGKHIRESGHVTSLAAQRLFLGCQSRGLW